MKEEIGKRIKQIREEMNMNKECFAKKLGISGQYLGMVERGQCFLSIEKLKKLCDMTNLSADFILFGKNENLTYEIQNKLSKYTEEQIKVACNTLKDIAILIKNT